MVTDIRSHRRALINKWVEALRSGEYRQVKNRLCRADRGGKEYCCLGVLAEVAGIELVPDPLFKGGLGVATERESDEVMSDVLPDSLFEKLTGLPGQDQCVLAEMNDSGEDFKTIADEIEKLVSRREG